MTKTCLKMPKISFFSSSPYFFLVFQESLFLPHPRGWCFRFRPELKMSRPLSAIFHISSLTFYTLSATLFYILSAIFYTSSMTLYIYIYIIGDTHFFLCKHHPCKHRQPQIGPKIKHRPSTIPSLGTIFSIYFFP